MPSRPTLLFLLSLPVGAVVFTVAAGVVQEIFPKEPILALLLPLFAAGLAMMPLVIPFFDRKARQDLAEYRRQQAEAPRADGQPTSDAAETPEEPEEPEAAEAPEYDAPDDTGGPKP
jgi:hypothetical protein